MINIALLAALAFVVGVAAGGRPRMGRSGSEARMALGAWIDFAIHNYQYLSKDA